MRVWPEQPNSVDRAEAVYESYKDNRDMLIPMDRLRDVFGAVEELEARYRREVFREPIYNVCGCGARYTLECQRCARSK